MTSVLKRSPVPIEITDLKSLVRLATSRGDYTPILFSFRYKGRELAASFLSLPFLRGSLPLFTYSYMETSPPPFIAYTNLEREEILYTSKPEAGKYFTCPIIRMDELPAFTLRALQSKARGVRVPASTRLSGLDSLMRLVAAMNDETSTPPIWYFQRGTRHILAIFYMLMEYYDSYALPLLCYVVLDEPPKGPFIAYLPGETPRMEFRDNVSDARYIYGRVVPVRNFPFSL